MAIEKTPSSRWFAEGKKDPHAGKYDCERENLSLGDHTDDELANAVFMYAGGRPSMPTPSISYLTAAKERIRWLSRKVNAKDQRIKQLEQELEQVKCHLEIERSECRRVIGLLNDVVNHKYIDRVLDWVICGICTNSSNGTTGRLDRMEKFYAFRDALSKAKEVVGEKDNS